MFFFFVVMNGLIFILGEVCSEVGVCDWFVFLFLILMCMDLGER